MKTGNMRRGGIGDTGVFPREYQSRTSALPPPQKMLQAPRKWDICQSSTIAGKAIFLWNVIGSTWKSVSKQWNCTKVWPEMYVGKKYFGP